MKNFLKLFFAIHLKGRFPGKSQGYNLNFITLALTMHVSAEKVFCKNSIKKPMITLSPTYLTLLLICRLF